MYKISKTQTGTEFENAAGIGIGEIDGNSYQATRSGKNLLKETTTDSGDGNYWSSYSTFDKATRTLTRATSSTTESFIQHKIDGIKSNTTYTLSLEAKSNGYVSSMDLFCYNSNIQGIKNRGGYSLTTSFQKITWTFTTDSSVDYSTGSSIRIDNNGSTTSGTDAILTVKNVMLVEGTDTNYEEYGVSPSPDYPSEVEVIDGCNLLNPTLATKTVTGITCTNNGDGTYTLNGTATANTYFTINNVDLKAGQTYRILGCPSGGSNTTYFTAINNLGGFDIGNGQNVTSDADVNRQFFVAVLQGTTVTNLLFKPMLTTNLSLTYDDFLPYGHIGIKQTGKNKIKISNTSYTSQGITTIYNNETGELSSNGTATGDYPWIATNSISIPANTTLTFSLQKNAEYETTIRLYYNSTEYSGKTIRVGSKSAQITTTSKAISYLILVKYVTGTVVSDTNYLQLELGSTTTDYEKYKETIYDIDLNGNTLCKVGDVEDKLLIDKKGNVSINKNIGNIVFTGADDENWAISTSLNSYRFSSSFDNHLVSNTTNGSTSQCNYFPLAALGGTWNNDNCYVLTAGDILVTLDQTYNTLSLFKKWLSEHNLELYYQLATSQTIELPSTTQIRLYEGYNNFELLTNLDTDYSITTYYKPMTDEVKTRVKNGKIVRAYMKFPATDTEEELIIDENNYLKELTLSDERYAPDEGFIGQAVAKEVTGEFYNISTDFNIQDREFELYVGVELEDGTTEYIKYGTFIVQKPENDTVSDNTSFTALDYMVKFNQTYTDRLTYPCTLKELFEDICDQAGVNYDVPSFLNEDFILEDNQLESGTTLREALKGIAQIAFNWARINEDNMVVMDFDKDIDVSEMIDSNQYFDLTTQNQYGELNTIVLKNSQVEGENYTIVDKNRVAKDGTIELTISDNPFAYTQEKRQQLIQAGEGLFGLKYIPLTTSTIGLFYLNCNDKIKVTDTANKEYETYVLNHSFTYNGVIIEETIEAEAQTLTETQYQFTTELERVYQHTELIVDKAKQEISATIENDTVSKSEYSQFKQDLEGWEATVSLKEDVTNQINILKEDITGITNTLESSGGNNIFYYSTDFWALPDGETTLCLEETTSTDISQNSLSGMGYILNKGTSEQKQSVKNGDYAINFSFKKTSSLSNQYIYINNTKYTITPESLNTWEEFIYTVNITTTSIDIKIESDTDNSAYITDFMVAPGTEGQTWTQNPNETFTDTVTIGKGITVKSSASNTYTTINNDGNRTFNSDTGERVAEMTDKGVYTKELEVEGQAKIGDLLIQTIDNQVWISGIGG